MACSAVGARWVRRDGAASGRLCRTGRCAGRFELRHDAVDRLLRGQVAEERFELGGVERLPLNELRGARVELVTVTGQDVLGPGVRGVDDRPDLVVDLPRDIVRVVALLADATAQEDHLVVLAERERPELLAHPELGDHPAGKLAGLLDVVGGARRGVPEDEPLGRVAAQHAGDLVFELGLALEIAILRREGHGVAERHPAADDRDLGPVSYTHLTLPTIYSV